MTGINIAPDAARARAVGVAPVVPCEPVAECKAGEYKDPVCYVDATGCQRAGTRRRVQAADCSVSVDEILDAAGAPVAGAKVVECSPGVRITNWCDAPPGGPGGPPPAPLDLDALAKKIFDATAPVRTACLTCR